MSSAAMDSAGDMALGYSVSSGSIYPSVRYTGRNATDALGTMQSEASLYAGSGSQTGYSRWGDYSSMQIDPVDDCTFWYVNEYLPVTSSYGWYTRIGSFKMNACSGVVTPDFTISATPSSATITQGNTATFTISIGSLSGFSGAVDMTVTGLPLGTYTLSPTQVTGSGTATLTTNGTLAAGSYTITITGVSGALTHSASVTLNVTPPVTGDFSLSVLQASQTVNRGGSTSYDVTQTASGGFTATTTFTVTGLPTGSSATFNPTSISGGSGSTGLTVRTAKGTKAGTYTLTITATGGGLTHSVSTKLIVN